MTAPQASPKPPTPAQVGGALAALLLILGGLFAAANQAGQQQQPTTTRPPTTVQTTRPPTTQQPVPTTARPTTSTPAPTTPPATGPQVTVRPSGGDDTAALAAAIAGNAVVVVDRPLRIDRVVKITAADRTIRFVGSGRLDRASVNDPDKPGQPSNVTFPVLDLVGARNVTIENPQIVGPGQVCDQPRIPPQPGLPDRMLAVFDARYESQHAIRLQATAGVTIVGGWVRDVRGDGVYLVDGAAFTRIDGLRTSCTGRSSISNVGSTHTLVQGGLFDRAALWIFNVEPYGQQRVDAYQIDRPGVGLSNAEWVWVGGTCNVTGVVVTKPDLTLRTRGGGPRGCGGPGVLTITR